MHIFGGEIPFIKPQNDLSSFGWVFTAYSDKQTE